jgi:hypothetical protein
MFLHSLRPRPRRRTLKALVEVERGATARQASRSSKTEFQFGVTFFAETLGYSGASPYQRSGIKNWLSSQPQHQTVNACFGSGRKTARWSWLATVRP